MPESLRGVVALLCAEKVVTQAQVTLARRVRAKLKPPSSLLAILKEQGQLSESVIHETLARNPGRVGFGDVLVDLGMVSDAELAAAREKQLTGSARRLGEILLADDLISDALHTGFDRPHQGAAQARRTIQQRACGVRALRPGYEARTRLFLALCSSSQRPSSSISGGT